MSNDQTLPERRMVLVMSCFFFMFIASDALHFISRLCLKTHIRVTDGL